MTSEEIEETQSGIEDSGMGGPGAPTPLSALEVLCFLQHKLMPMLMLHLGYCRSHEERHTVDSRWWLQHRGVCCLHSETDPRADQGYLGTESYEDIDRG
jgi:hypothetical protein